MTALYGTAPSGLNLSGIGKSPNIAAPKDFLPDEDKPDGIAAALARMGIERKKPDAGMPVSGPSEPEDDADEVTSNPISN